jgi:hypothetical protein
MLLNSQCLCYDSTNSYIHHEFMILRAKSISRHIAMAWELSVRLLNDLDIKFFGLEH